MNKIIHCLTFLTLVPLPGCMLIGDPSLDSTQQYFQRADTVTLSAGNAKEVNTRIHVIDPWPRHSGDNTITGNGERMVGAAERYRDISKQSRTSRPLPLIGSTSDSSAATTPAQP
jgi:hypothetical protein